MSSLPAAPDIAPDAPLTIWESLPADWGGDIVEIFAGPGGWDEALRAHGLDDRSLGWEKDKDACGTAVAAGHRRILADVAMVDLRPLQLRRLFLLIGSPPCQSFSKAGRQKGKLDAPRILRHVARIREAGRWLHYSREGWHDPRSPLVLEPLRWALTLKPERIALEQVEAVLPLWDAFAEVLRDHGWHVDTGALSSEQYGVPQTRKRAFLIARRCERPLCGPGCAYSVSLPAPTHRPYRKGVGQDQGDPSLLPWVSMAEALSLAEGGLIGFPRRPDTCAGHVPPGAPPCPKHAGGELIEPDGQRYKRRDLRLTEEPAKTLTEHVRSWQLRQSAQARATVRAEGEPAPTITAGHDRAERVWEPTDGTLPLELHSSGVAAADRDGRARVAPRPETDPAPTIRGSGRHAGYWAEQRPATTVQGDPRIWPPGHKVNADDQRRLGEDAANERYGDRAGSKAVRVTVAQAAVLQSMRPDYPFQGSRTAQYRQVGDMVPPLLAWHVLASVIG